MIDIGGRHPLITIAGGVSALVGVVVTTLTLASVFAAASGTPGALSAIRRMLEATEAQGAEAAQSQEALQERARVASRTGLLGGILGWLTVLAVAVILTPLMMAAGGGSANVPEGEAQPPTDVPDRSRRLPRAPWLPRITVLGVVNGLLAGAAGVVLLQQFSVVYSDLWVAIGLLVAGAAVYGLLLPTLGYTIAWLRVNRRVDELERSLGWR